jgi:hypothetical protein
MIDMASVFAERYKQNPQALQAAVLGQSPDPRLDPYTALNALRLVKESNMMAMARQGQQPTSSPSIVAENMAPNPMQQGLGAMIPGAMGQGAPAPQGMPAQGMPAQGQGALAPQGMAPQGQAPVMQRSGGLAGMPIPDYEYAQGGIVAFKDEGLVKGRDYTQEVLDSIADDKRREDYGTEQEPGWNQDDGKGSGSSMGQNPFNPYLIEAIESMKNYDEKTMSEADQDAAYRKAFAREKELSGPDIYAPANQTLAKRESAIAGDERYGQGLALLSAAGNILKGRNFAEGASNAAPAFAQQMADIKRASIQEQRSIEQMKFAYADAQRKENIGMHRAAQASVESARKFQQDANAAGLNKLRGIAQVAAQGATANKPYARGAGSGPKWQEQVLQNNIDYLKTTQKPKPGESDEAFNARVRKQASDITTNQLKTLFSNSTGEIGPVNAATRLAPVQVNIDTKVNEALQKFANSSAAGTAYRAARRAGNVDEANSLLKAEETRLRKVFEASEAAAGGGDSAKPRNTGKIPAPPNGFLPDTR